MSESSHGRSYGQDEIIKAARAGVGETPVIDTLGRLTQAAYALASTVARLELECEPKPLTIRVLAVADIGSGDGLIRAALASKPVVNHGPRGVELDTVVQLCDEHDRWLGELTLSWVAEV